MSTDTITVTGLFKTQKETLAAVEEIQQQGWQVTEVRSPIPDSALAKALGRKKEQSRLVYIDRRLYRIFFRVCPGGIHRHKMEPYCQREAYCVLDTLFYHRF